MHKLVLDVLLTNGDPSGPRVLVDEAEASQGVELWFTNPDKVPCQCSHSRQIAQDYRNVTRGFARAADNVVRVRRRCIRVSHATPG